MPALLIPGFYFDETKKKYFKVQANHAAPEGSKYSRVSLQKEAEDEMIRSTQERHQQHVAQQRIQTSRIVRNPISRVTLQREVGNLSNHSKVNLSDYNAVWAQHLTKQTIFPHKVSRFVYDNVTESFVYARDGLDYSTINLRYRDQSVGVCNARPSITSLSISPSRAILSTSAGLDGNSMIIISQLPTPEALNSPIRSQVCQPSTGSNWASSARPCCSTSDFALATDMGVVLITQRGGDIPLMSTLETHTTVLAVDWLDQNILIGGCRNGHVLLWDTRTTGRHATENRFLHPSCVGHVKRVNENRIAVAGLSNRLCIYDLRKPFSSTQSYSESYLTFGTYRNSGLTGNALGFDVHQNLVAAGTDGNEVQLFNVDDGKEIARIPTQGIPNCVRLVDREMRSSLVVASEKTEEWDWAEA